MSVDELKTELARADAEIFASLGMWPEIPARLALEARYKGWRADAWPSRAFGFGPIIGKGDTPETAIDDMHAKIDALAKSKRGAA